MCIHHLTIFVVALCKVVFSVPCYFLIYINDIIDCFDDKVNCKLYADDAKLYTELRSADSYCFQECIDRIYQ